MSVAGSRAAKNWGCELREQTGSSGRILLACAARQHEPECDSIGKA